MVKINFNDFFEYKDGEIYWKSRPARCCRVGEIAGGINSKGYRRVHIKREYAVHRVIWEMHNGPIPKGFQIDHIDRNPLNNKINNLRIASLGQNRANIKKLNHKKGSKSWSKYKGVKKVKDGMFYCIVKRIYKGSFKTEIEAAMAYDKFAKDFFGEFCLTNADIFPDDFE